MFFFVCFFFAQPLVRLCVVCGTSTSSVIFLELRLGGFKDGAPRTCNNKTDQSSITVDKGGVNNAQHFWNTMIVKPIFLHTENNVEIQ
jgi:hypothetical protein